LHGTKLPINFDLPKVTGSLIDTNLLGKEKFIFKTNNMIMITGATGQLGNAVLKLMIEKMPAGQVAALARNTDKLSEFAALGVDVRKGDYNDTDSLAEAFKGIEKLYFVSGSEVGKRAQQHANVINAAKQAGVKHVIYTSFQRKTENGDSAVAFVAQEHLITEKLIKESGINYTILKHALYLDVLPMFFGPNVTTTGIFIPAGNGKASYAARADMAAAAVAILTTPGHENKVYEISAPHSYSFQELAQTLTEITGKQVAYTSPDVPTFTGALTAAGVPADLIGMTTGFALGIEQGEFDFPSPTLAQLLGRDPMTPKEFFSSIY
jgi:NAD(P)H dehydrogenase (quinone)